MSQTQTYIKVRYQYLKSIYSEAFQSIPGSLCSTNISSIRQGSEKNELSINSDDIQGNDSYHPNFHEQHENQKKHPDSQDSSIVQKKRVSASNFRKNKQPVQYQENPPSQKPIKPPSLRENMAQSFSNLSGEYLIDSLQFFKKKEQRSQSTCEKKESHQNILQKLEQQKSFQQKKSFRQVESTNRKVEEFIIKILEIPKQKVINLKEFEQKKRQVTKLKEELRQNKKKYQKRQQELTRRQEIIERKQRQITQSKIQFSTILQEKQKKAISIQQQLRKKQQQFQRMSRQQNKMKQQIQRLKNSQMMMKKQIENLQMEGEQTNFVTEQEFLEKLKELQDKFLQQLTQRDESHHQKIRIYEEELSEMREQLAKFQEKQNGTEVQLNILNQKMEQSKLQFAEQITKLGEALIK